MMGLDQGFRLFEPMLKEIQCGVWVGNDSRSVYICHKCARELPPVQRVEFPWSWMEKVGCCKWRLGIRCMGRNRLSEEFRGRIWSMSCWGNCEPRKISEGYE